MRRGGLFVRNNLINFYSTLLETSIGSSLLKEFCGGKVPTGIKQ